MDAPKTPRKDIDDDDIYYEDAGVQLGALAGFEGLSNVPTALDLPPSLKIQEDGSIFHSENSTDLKDKVECRQEENSLDIVPLEKEKLLCFLTTPKKKCIPEKTTSVPNGDNVEQINNCGEIKDSNFFENSSKNSEPHIEDKDVSSDRTSEATSTRVVYGRIPDHWVDFFNSVSCTSVKKNTSNEVLIVRKRDPLPKKRIYKDFKKSRIAQILKGLPHSNDFGSDCLQGGERSKSVQNMQLSLKSSVSSPGKSSRKRKIDNEAANNAIKFDNLRSLFPPPHDTPAKKRKLKGTIGSSYQKTEKLTDLKDRIIMDKMSKNCQNLYSSMGILKKAYDMRLTEINYSDEVSHLHVSCKVVKCYKFVNGVSQMELLPEKMDDIDHLVVIPAPMVKKLGIMDHSCIRVFDPVIIRSNLLEAERCTYLCTNICHVLEKI